MPHVHNRKKDERFWGMHLIFNFFRCITAHSFVLLVYIYNPFLWYILARLLFLTSLLIIDEHIAISKMNASRF
jgi:hypothetical protein